MFQSAWGLQTEWSEWGSLPICPVQLYHSHCSVFSLCRLEPLTSEMKQMQVKSNIYLSKYSLNPPLTMSPVLFPHLPIIHPLLPCASHPLPSSTHLSSSIVCPPILFPHLPTHPLPLSDCPSSSLILHCIWKKCIHMFSHFLNVWGVLNCIP